MRLLALFLCFAFNAERTFMEIQKHFGDSTLWTWKLNFKRRACSFRSNVFVGTFQIFVPSPSTAQPTTDLHPYCQSICFLSFLLPAPYFPLQTLSFCLCSLPFPVLGGVVKAMSFLSLSAVRVASAGDELPVDSFVFAEHSDSQCRVIPPKLAICENSPFGRPLFRWVSIHRQPIKAKRQVIKLEATPLCCA